MSKMQQQQFQQQQQQMQNGSSISYVGLSSLEESISVDGQGSVTGRQNYGKQFGMLFAGVCCCVLEFSSGVCL